jgi:hypothetical protein
VLQNAASRVVAAFSRGLGASLIPNACGPQPPSSTPPSPSFFQVEVGPLRRTHSSRSGGQSAHPGPPAGGEGEAGVRSRRCAPLPRHRPRLRLAPAAVGARPHRAGEVGVPPRTVVAPEILRGPVDRGRDGSISAPTPPAPSPSPRSISHSSIRGEVHGRRGGGPCRCLNLSTSMGGTRSKVESGDRHDLEPEGTRDDTRHKIYTGSGSQSSYPMSFLE